MRRHPLKIFVANVWKIQINPVTLHSLSKGNATETVQNESNLDDILDIVQQERKQEVNS